MSPQEEEETEEGEQGRRLGFPEARGSVGAGLLGLAEGVDEPIEAVQGSGRPDEER